MRPSLYQTDNTFEETTMTLPYRKHYNQDIRSVSPSDFRSLDVLLQVSTTEIYRISHDPEDGFHHGVIRLVDSKTRIEGCDARDTFRRVNMRSRRDLLRFLLKWDEQEGEALGDGELEGLLGDVHELCHHYNNVVILDKETEMGFEDLKDLSKRKLRVRGTGTYEPEYYKPEELLLYEERLVKEEERLADLKRDLVSAIESDRPGLVTSLAPKVASMMRDVMGSRQRVEEMRESARYLGLGG